MTRLTASLVFALLVSTAPQALSAGAVARGDFHTLDDPPGIPVEGHATLIRTGDGRTHVSVQVSGLEPGAVYASHVHNKACNDSRGGDHYQDQVGGPAEPPNELWVSSDPQNAKAGLAANSAGHATGHGIAPWTARSDARSVVIHQTGDPSVRIACADLA